MGELIREKSKDEKTPKRQSELNCHYFVTR